MRKRLVITGMGVVTPIGVGTEKYWTATIEGRAGVRKITSFDVSNYPTRIAAEVKPHDFDPQGYFDKQDIAMMGKSIQFALVAAQMAMSDSFLNVDQFAPDKAGISMGVTEELDDYIYSFCEAFFATSYVDNGQKKRDMKKLAEYCRTKEKFCRGFITSFPDFVTTKIASTYNILGPCLSVDTACAAGAQAIVDACRIIERGEADVMICGGTESLGGPNILLMFSLLNAISTNNTEPEKASRPFDAKRDGFVLGEGAGILIVESLEHALKRDARIHSEIIGFGVSCDAYRVTDEPPDGRGAIKSMRKALEAAGVQPEQVDYINAHGTSTPMNDKVETFAIKQVFDEHAFKIPISSSKSMIGHLIAAAGAVELITCILTMREGIIPPTINYQFPDPDCDLDYVPNEARTGEINVALSNSFGFGGQNVSLLVKKYSDN